jgi:hypothetical protein
MRGVMAIVSKQAEGQKDFPVSGPGEVCHHKQFESRLGVAAQGGGAWSPCDPSSISSDDRFELALALIGLAACLLSIVFNWP